MKIAVEGNTDKVKKRQDSFEDLLKHAQGDPKTIGTNQTEDAVAAARAKRAKKKNLFASSIEAEDENLGDDFEATPWLPPSVEKATEFKTHAIFRNGDIRLDSINVIQAPDLGTGVTLYFQFAMSMAISLFVMSVLSLPSLVMIYSGSGVSPQDRDALGLYRYTLGNIGYNKESPSYTTNSHCHTPGYDRNTSCIHFGADSEISLTDAGSILTAMEFLQVFVFFVCVFSLHRQVLTVAGRNSKEVTAISDYSITIRNIPTDTKEAELVEHFNKLYQLGEADYRGRPALTDARPVQNTEFSHDSYLVGTWVAECIIHKSIGSFISAFKDKQHIMEKLYRCRAQMKMYAENSCHAAGHNLKRFLKAEQEMIRQGTLIDKLTADNLKKGGLRILNDFGSDVEQGHPKSPTSGTATGNNSSYNTTGPAGTTTQPFNRHMNNNVYKNIDAVTVAAFLCFEYSESLARCIEDYEKYQTWPMSMFYPEHLKFRGMKIKVRKAPEPDQIVWENLEVSNQTKRYLRTRTTIITTVLVILCFIVILQASIYKQIFSDKIPSSAVCEKKVPSLYNSNSATYYSTSVSSYELTRPPNDEATLLDSVCEQTIPETFYAVYSKTKNYLDPVVTYSMAACNTGTHAGDICPVLGSAEYCPCVSIRDSTICKTGDCDFNTQSSECTQFKASAIGSCYCYNELSDILSSLGVAAALDKLSAQSSEDDPCYNFYKNYTLSSGLTYVSVIITTVVNTLLRMFLKSLALQEAHASVDKEQGSIMSKIFMSNFATMAIIVLVAYGQAPNSPQFIKDIHVFNGPYSDFNQAWYGNVGFYFMTTFILQSFTPLASNLIEYYVTKPVMRQYHHSRAAVFKSHYMVMQNDLNMLEVGPVFDATTHTAQLLTLLFFAMTFAPGLPLLMPLCCFAFIMYFRVDKMLLCRFYQKPPHIGDGSIRIVLSYLPYAGLIRMGFALWMFSCGDIFPHDSIVSTHGNNEASGYVTFLQKWRGTVPPYLRDRITQANTFPLFVAIIVIAGIMFIRYVWEYLPMHWILKFCNMVIKAITTKEDYYKSANAHTGTIDGWELMKLQHPLRQEMAPYTGEYYRYVKHKDEIPDTCIDMCSYHYLTGLSELEVEEGWVVKDWGDYVIRVKLYKENLKSSSGALRKRGDAKKTYEVINDHRCNTYNIEKVPAYKMAMKGLREGTSSMLADDDDDEDVGNEEYYKFLQANSPKTADPSTPAINNPYPPQRRQSHEMHVKSVIDTYNHQPHHMKDDLIAHQQEHQDEGLLEHITHGILGGHTAATATNSSNENKLGGVPVKAAKNRDKYSQPIDTNNNNSKSSSTTPKQYSTGTTPTNGNGKAVPPPPVYKYNFDAYENHEEDGTGEGDGIYNPTDELNEKVSKHKKNKNKPSPKSHSNSFTNGTAIAVDNNTGYDNTTYDTNYDTNYQENYNSDANYDTNYTAPPTADVHKKQKKTKKDKKNKHSPHTTSHNSTHNSTHNSQHNSAEHSYYDYGDNEEDYIPVETNNNYDQQSDFNHGESGLI